ncbi:MAG TPA: IclR family transcriptional regulator [Solirubrobacteraceae bacterium]|nr:IclR family transcriptional regulator [Solirubrobacteraceae bacterium]
MIDAGDAIAVARHGAAGDSPSLPAYPVGSVDTAIRLLLIVAEREEVGVSAAARELAVARSTAHRLMQMLQYHGLVQQRQETKTYVPGPTLAKIGLLASRSLDIRAVAQPRMATLMEIADETVHLFTLRGSDVVCLHSVECKRPLRVGRRVGESLPAYATAAGRCLLAGMDSSRVHELYPSEQLPAIQPGTIASRDALEQELERVRDRGFAVQQQQTESDVNAIGAAIYDRLGPPTLAITISMPSSRFDEADADRLGKAARECADGIASALSW